MRYAVAVGIVAISLAAALYVHQRHTWTTVERMAPDTNASGFGSSYDVQVISARVRRHPSWEDPVAVLIAVGGVAVAVGIAAYHRPLARPS